jgi:predicted acyltransferase
MPAAIAFNAGGGTTVVAARSTRLVSLDVFRGLLGAAVAGIVKTLVAIKVGEVDGAPLSLWSYLYARGFEPFFDPYIASPVFALANLAVLFALLAWMYRRQFFLRV